VAQTTDDQFSQLEGRIKGQGAAVSGELVVTSLAGFSDLVVPVLAEFQRLHPDVVVRYLTGNRLFRLEYGEAHVAIRAGNAPDQPDNVAQPFFTSNMGLYASKTYIERMGMPVGPPDYAQHHFVGIDNADSRAPFARWMRANIPAESIRFLCSDMGAMQQAVCQGAGIGFVSAVSAHGRTDLVPVCEPLAEWGAPLWLVTHVDLHRTAKVQAFLALLKERAKHWFPA
jgi:DNA-binding transcriptional LysR family regulator